MVVGLSSPAPRRPGLLRRGAVVAGSAVLGTTGLSALAVPALAQGPSTLYVAPNGTDEINGCEEQSRPCRTIGHAIALARFDDDPVIVISVAGGASYDEDQTIRLFEGRSLVIEPTAGTGTVTVNGTGRGSSVFTIDHSDVTLRGLTISRGTAAVHGGGVEIDGGTVALIDDTIVGNTAGHVGGGVDIDGGVVMLTGDSVAGNTAGAVGGGVYNGGTATLAGDTVTGNLAPAGGGGLYNAGTATLHNDTLTGDRTSFTGAGLYNGPHGTATLTGVTSWNERGNDIVPGATLYDTNPAPRSVQVAGSILAEPADYTQGACSGNKVSAPDGRDGAYNVVTDGSCATGAADMVSTPAQINLQPLAANGSSGPQTSAFQLPSTAFKAVPTASGLCLPTDERGLPRPGTPGDGCDAGAYELQGAVVVPPHCACEPAASEVRTPEARAGWFRRGGAHAAKAPRARR